ncbi:MAG: DUF3800 domain-containing protein [Candidatus Saccharimonadales bacterium]
MKVLYIDETGDHSLSKIDKSYPIFVLSGVICDMVYHDGELTDYLNALKLKHFGTEDIVLHSKEMTHPQSANNKLYMSFINMEFRKKFYADFEKLLSSLRISLVACVILKNKHLIKYGLEAKDPYLLSFDNLINQLIFNLDDTQKGKIVAESRNSVLDNQLKISYLSSRVKGTNKVQAAEIKLKLASSIEFKQKSDNIAGLQIADMVASPIARYHLNKPERVGHQLKYKTVFKKVKNINGRRKNIGITILPM